MGVQVEYIKGWGKFGGPDKIEVALLDGGSSTIHTKNTIIATGSEVAPLQGIPIDEERCAGLKHSAHGSGDELLRSGVGWQANYFAACRIVSSTGALTLKEVPEKLIVIGGGYIGLEMGSVWERLGSSVTVVEFGPAIVPTMVNAFNQHPASQQQLCSLTASSVPDALLQDGEIRKQFERSLKKQGFNFMLNTKV